jgi:putative peptidoglycan lipid II flippase
VTRLAPAGPPESDRQERPGSGIARGAALIAGLTMLSRALGLIRTLVFSQTVGAGCVGTAYVTANQVPNLLYELVVGGALTGAMVPILARSAERSADPAEKARVSQVTSAALTWSLLVLVPLTVVVAVAAGPIASLLDPANPNSHCNHAQVVSTTSSMLVVFAPQVVLYGVSAALFGLLQAYRRFTGPALAPVIASLVLIASYLAFVPLAKGLPLARLPLAAQLALSGGATLGVGALVAIGLLPAWRLHLRLRPTLRFPAGIARRAGGLALVGVIEIIANDLSTVAVIALANGRGVTGALVIFNYAWLAFSSVHAVLALAIAMSAYPVLAARDGAVFDRTCAGSTRAILLVSWLGTAVLVAIAAPAAHVLAKNPAQVTQVFLGLVTFAPGLAAVGVIASLSRAMFALGRLKVAGMALTGSWVLVIIADVALAGLAPAKLVVAALGLGNTIGQTLVAIPLVIATRRIRGRAAVAGVGRANWAGLAAAVAGTAAGLAVGVTLPLAGKVADAGIAVLAALCAMVVFSLVAYASDSGDLKSLLAQGRRRLSGLRPSE